MPSTGIYLSRSTFPPTVSGWRIKMASSVSFRRADEGHLKYFERIRWLCSTQKPHATCQWPHHLINSVRKVTRSFAYISTRQGQFWQRPFCPFMKAENTNAKHLDKKKPRIIISFPRLKEKIARSTACVRRAGEGYPQASREVDVVHLTSPFFSGKCAWIALIGPA